VLNREATANPITNDQKARANHQTSKQRKYQRRGITLLSVVGKVLCRFIIICYYNYRIRSGVDGMLRKEQAGYRKGRGEERTGIYTAGRD